MQTETLVTRRRFLILALWVCACAALLLFVPAGDPAANEHSSFLPADSGSRVASELLGTNFPSQAGLSQAVIFFERSDGPLTVEDQAFINNFALKIPYPYKGDLKSEDLAGVRVSSPGMIDVAIGLARNIDILRSSKGLMRRFLDAKTPKSRPGEVATVRNPLRTAVSEAGQSAMVRVNIPSNFITYRSARIVRHIRDILANSPRPAGLKAAVTGSGGYGYDYGQFVEQSHDRTIYATILAVIVILLVVYRAPLAAMAPLVAIGLAASIVFVLMNLAQGMGASIGLAERIFVFVLMYGAGIDYSLLYISRYREMLGAGRDPRLAAGEALGETFPAILASAATDSIGIFMLIFCRFLIFQSTGPAVAAGILVSMLAAVTLIPAMVRILGPRMFWPGGPVPSGGEISGARHGGRFWPGLARMVTRRPLIVLAVMGAILAIPACRAVKINWVYDALAGIESEWLDGEGEATTPAEGVGNAAAGIEMAGRHLPIGEIAPVAILVESSQGLSLGRWWEISHRLTERIARMEGVQNVRSATRPMGLGAKIGDDAAAQRMLRDFASREYLSGDGRFGRLEAVMNMHTMSTEAMHMAGRIRRAAEEVVADEGLDASVYLGGATAEMIEIRAVTQHDFRLVVVLVLGVIFLIVLALLRDWVLTAFMVGVIVLSYMATLGLCAWAFAWLFGTPEMDWKVQIFLFVVMASVGVDYNIFLAARLAQEARTAGPAEAVRRALVHTGPVISSCGLIMAGTLGSLMVGRVELLKQLGFAMALGMLMDTFAVRPLLLPAFAVLFKRTGRSGILLGRRGGTGF